MLLLGDAPDVRPALDLRRSRAGEDPAEFGRYQPVASQARPPARSDRPADAPAPARHARPDPRRACTSSCTCRTTPRPGRIADAHADVAAARRSNVTVNLTVWDFTLPDHLSFLPEMNCYGLPANERDYYRLAHRHRTVLNRVPYSQNGEVADGCAPSWDGQTLDWSAWDRRFGPLLDGSAFADLPAPGRAVECFYLPLHENWPSPDGRQLQRDYWADQAFPPKYRAGLRRGLAAVRRALQRARAGTRRCSSASSTARTTSRRNGWSRGSSPWLLDEPANFQDYWALR